MRKIGFIFFLLTAGFLAALCSPHYAEGQGTTTVVGPFGGNPGGSNTQVQFNNNGAFGGSSALTWNGSFLCVGTVCATAAAGDISASRNANSGAIFFGTTNNAYVFENNALHLNTPVGSVIAEQTGSPGPFQAGTYTTGTNCSSSASPAVCGSAAAGSVVVAAAATTVAVNTTAVTANSQILLTRDDSLGTKLSVTCNTATVMGEMKVSARTAGTSFTITVQTTPATNPGCISYSIVN